MLINIFDTIKQIIMGDDYYTHINPKGRMLICQ